MAVESEGVQGPCNGRCLRKSVEFGGGHGLSMMGKHRQHFLIVVFCYNGISDLVRQGPSLLFSTKDILLQTVYAGVDIEGQRLVRKQEGSAFG